MHKNNYLLIASLMASTILLPACTMDNLWNNNPNDTAYQTNAPVTPPPSNAPVSYYATPQHSRHYDSSDVPAPKKVKVPESALLSASGPKSHRDVDSTWVAKQKSDGYTIELVSDDKPAAVAKTLYHAPKNERTAEVKSSKDGKTTYTGLYGSYNDKAAAEKALESLPPQLKAKASIHQWNTVQQQTQAVAQPSPAPVVNTAASVNSQTTTTTTTSDNNNHDAAKSE